jgi:hypothetical protein
MIAPSRSVSAGGLLCHVIELSDQLVSTDPNTSIVTVGARASDRRPYSRSLIESPTCTVPKSSLRKASRPYRVSALSFAMSSEAVPKLVEAYGPDLTYESATIRGPSAPDTMTSGRLLDASVALNVTYGRVS